mmetsp:Transcript_7545/g.21989  ORF Transcript_7545/g.21989 Transcript_7545/m.21989 type:complete len:237 (+) Transcript_7545:478-1188(+)
MVQIAASSSRTSCASEPLLSSSSTTPTSAELTCRGARTTHAFVKRLAPAPAQKAIGQKLASRNPSSSKPRLGSISGRSRGDLGRSRKRRRRPYAGESDGQRGGADRRRPGDGCEANHGGVAVPCDRAAGREEGGEAEAGGEGKHGAPPRAGELILDAEQQHPSVRGLAWQDDADGGGGGRGDERGDGAAREDVAQHHPPEQRGPERAEGDQEEGERRRPARRVKCRGAAAQSTRMQ